MFKLLNTTGSDYLEAEISNRGNSILFNLGFVIFKKNKEDINPLTQYKLLNGYLDYKGEEFKDKLYQLYLAADREITDLTDEDVLDKLPIKSTHNILDMFDLDDIRYYLKDLVRLEPPGILAKEYDEELQKKERNKEITRVQTYVVEDYYDLAVTNLPLKAILPIVVHFGYLKTHEIHNKQKEYTLYNIIKGHPIDNSPAFQKLRGWTEKLIDNSNVDNSTASVSIIEKGVSIEEVPEVIFSKIVIQKVAMADLLSDSKNGGQDSIIKRCYAQIIGGIGNKTDSRNRISDKKPVTDPTSGDKESIVESYRLTTEVTQGTIMEQIVSVSDLNVIARSMPVPLNRKFLHYVRKMIDGILDRNFTEEQESMCRQFCSTIIDPRGVDFIEEEQMLNIIAATFVYLWDTGHKELANIIIAKASTIKNTYNGGTVHKNRIPQTMKDELNIYFPYTRSVNAIKVANTTEEYINVTSNNLLDSKWVSILPKEYLDMLEPIAREVVVPSNIKILLGQALIDNEKLREKMEDIYV